MILDAEAEISSFNDTDFQAGSNSLIFTWLALAWVGLPLLLGVIMLKRVLTDENSRYLEMATTLGVIGFIAQVIGLLRWVFVVPVLAHLFADPGTDSVTQASISTVFVAVHQYGGIVLGEHLGQFLTILWMSLVSGILYKSKMFSKWVAWLGWFASTVYILAQTELLATAIPSFPVIDRAELYMAVCCGWSGCLSSAFTLSNTKRTAFNHHKEKKMKAIVYTKYGPPDVLQPMEVAKPEPKEDQVLVKVRAASANALDYRRFEKLSTMGRFMEEQFIKPIGKALGADISGVVEAVGANVKQFQPGDEVFGVVAGSRGGFAEYACAAEGHLALKPTNLSFEAAAAVPVAALTALQGLRDKGQIQPGQKVLINGASGGVGTFALQIAKAFSAEVTAVCSKRNLNMTLSIGADHVIDNTKEDFTKKGFACYSRITRNR